MDLRFIPQNFFNFVEQKDGQQFLAEKACMVSVPANCVIFVPAGYISYPIYWKATGEAWTHMWWLNIFVKKWAKELEAQ